MVGNGVHGGLSVVAPEPRRRVARSSWRTTVPVLLIGLLVSACSASGPRYRPVAPSSGEAIINVYRPDRFPGSANVYHLVANGQHIAEVSNGGYCVYRAEPGNVSFSTELRPGVGTILPALLMKEQELITVPAEAGETYYVRFDVMGPSMELVPPAEGAAEIADLREFDLVGPNASK